MYVGIVGAGVAGLVTAYQLGQRGHRVTILERQDRVGGRAMTLPSRFADGLVAQTGPTRFPCDLKRVFAYADRFGLQLVPYYPSSGTVVAFIGGQRIADYQASPEEFWGYAAIVNRYPGPIERLGLQTALLARSLARRILGRRKWLTYGIRGGTQRLTDALAQACGAEIRLGTTVRSVAHGTRGVELGWSSPQGDGTLSADVAVCATPLSMHRDLRFSPDISAEKRALSEEVPFSSAIRIFLQMRRAYWRDHGHNGFAVTDTVGEVWDPHFDGRGEPALLVCYAKDGLADRLCALSEADRVEYAVREVENVFPGAADHFVHGESFCWREQPWIRGGWPLVRLGFADRAEEFRRPENRIYFAGDYASAPLFLNTVEGAIESGEYVADQIHGRTD